MVENTLYDKKSLRTVVGKTADFDELAKDCVAFANAQGGIIEIGIENNEKLPPVGQTFDEKLPVNIVNKLAGLTNNITMQADEETKSNGGKVIVLHIYRSIAIAMTSKGKIYIRIGDNSVPVTSSEDILRLAADKNSYSWEDAVTQFDWHKADPEKLEYFLSQIRDSDRVSDFVKSKDTKELLDFFGMTDAESDKMTNLGVLFIGQQTQRGRLSNAPVIQCIKYDEYGEKVNKWLWDDYRMNPKEMIDSIWEIVPEWKESYDAKRKTQSKFVKDRLMKNVEMFSNGESALKYFVDKIDKKGVYLLDEPENSLSISLQLELMEYLENSARFFGCQFIIASHSPVFLSIPGAKIYDLDSVPVKTKKWTELENVRKFRDFFKAHESEFEDPED